MRLLDCNSLSLGYPGHVLASNLSFALDTGQCLCIVGENGVGKSSGALAVQNAAEFAPVWESFVHEGLELRAVVARLEMGQFVDDHVLDALPRPVRQHDGVRHSPLRAVADAPASHHAAQLPGNAELAQSGCPCGVQLAK